DPAACAECGAALRERSGPRAAGRRAGGAAAWPWRLGYTPERCCAGEAVPSAAPGAPATGSGSRRSEPGFLSAGGSRMSAPHLLNQAVIAQALHDLRNGQLRRCKAMGFGEEELDALKHPELVSMLVHATVSWCSMSVNREGWKRLLGQLHDVAREISPGGRMLPLAASTEVVSKVYGLSHQEVALRRDILGLPKRKGRHPGRVEAQDVALWERRSA